MTSIKRTDIWFNAYSEDKERREHFKKQLCSLNESRIWILKTLLKLKGVKNVLDVACGPGLDMDHLKEMTDKIPFSYTGIDFTPSFIDEAMENHPDQEFRVAHVMDIPFKDNSFDVVYTRHSLEHVSDPHVELDEMFRLAKKYVIIGWFRLVDTETKLQVKSNKFGEYPLHDLNREEFTKRIEEWGSIEDTFTIKHNECWLVKKHPRKKGKK